MAPLVSSTASRPLGCTKQTLCKVAYAGPGLSVVGAPRSLARPARRHLPPSCCAVVWSVSQLLRKWLLWRLRRICCVSPHPFGPPVTSLRFGGEPALLPIHFPSPQGGGAIPSGAGHPASLACDLGDIQVTIIRIASAMFHKQEVPIVVKKKVINIKSLSTSGPSRVLKIQRKKVMRNIFYLLFALTANPTLAEWLQVFETEKLLFYIDPTFHKKDDLRRVWEVQNRNASSEQHDAKSRKSMKILMEYDCVNKQTRPVSFSSHSEPMASGETLYSSNIATMDWRPIQSNSAAEAVLKLVCPN